MVVKKKAAASGELVRARKRTVDMSNVKDKGPFNPKHVPEGDYLAKIVDVYDSVSKNDAEMWVIAFQLVDRRDIIFPYYCIMDDNNLWKVRNVFEAAGVKVPKSRMVLDPTRIIGKTVGIGLEDDEYEGKPKSVISSVMPAKELQDEDAGDEEPDDDDVEDDDVEEEEEPPPAKKKTTRRRKPEPEPEEEEEDDEEDDEEEPEPPKKRRTAAARAGGRAVKGSTRTRAASKRRAADDDEDDDELDVDDDDL